MAPDFYWVYVECHSGHRYSARPLSFIWGGEKRYVKNIEREWLEPGHRHFRVLTTDDSRFELVYNEQKDGWQAVQLVD